MAYYDEFGNVIDKPIGLSPWEEVDEASGFKGLKNVNKNDPMSVASFMSVNNLNNVDRPQDFDRAMDLIFGGPWRQQPGAEQFVSQQVIPAFHSNEDRWRTADTKANRSGNMAMLGALGFGGLGALGYLGGATAGVGSLPTIGEMGFTAAELGAVPGATAGGLGGATATGGSVWDSIGQSVSKGVTGLGNMFSDKMVGGLVSGATSAALAGQTRKDLGPTRQASQFANDVWTNPDSWKTQSFIPGLIDYAVDKEQKRLNSLGYNRSGNLSQGLVDTGTRAGYNAIIPWMQGASGNVSAQAGAGNTMTGGNQVVNPLVNSALGNVFAGANTPTKQGTTLSDMYMPTNGMDYPRYSFNQSAWGDGNDPFTMGYW